MWKRRIQLARLHKRTYYWLYYGFGPKVDDRLIDVQDKLEIGPNDPRLQEACKKAWDELDNRQTEIITSGGFPSWSSWWGNADDLGTELVDEEDCLHITFYTYYNTGKWHSAINQKGICVVCGKKGFKPKRK